MQFAHLDRQTGTDGEHWRIAGLTDGIARPRFEATSTLAGRKLLETDYQPPEIFPDATDHIRWYRRLAFNSPHFQHGVFGHLQDDNGNNVGWVSSGSIHRPAAVAATMCLELMSMTNEPSDSTAPGGLNINVSGPNSRVNIGSHDQSTNVVSNSTSIQLFQDLRESIAAGVQPAEQGPLLARVDALELAVNKPTFLDRYKEFIQAAANHASIIGPFLPALANLLK